MSRSFRDLNWPASSYGHRRACILSLSLSVSLSHNARLLIEGDVVSAWTVAFLAIFCIVALENVTTFVIVLLLCLLWLSDSGWLLSKSLSVKVLYNLLHAFVFLALLELEVLIGFLRSKPLHRPPIESLILLFELATAVFCLLLYSARTQYWCRFFRRYFYRFLIALKSRSVQYRPRRTNSYWFSWSLFYLGTIRTWKLNLCFLNLNLSRWLIITLWRAWTSRWCATNSRCFAHWFFICFLSDTLLICFGWHVTYM